MRRRGSWRGLVPTEKGAPRFPLPASRFPLPASLRKLREPHRIPPGLLHVNLRAPVERLVTWFDDGRAGERFLDVVEIADGDEQRDRMPGQVAGRVRVLADYARPRLVHDLDPALLDAGENQLAVGARHLIVHHEAQPVSPELDARLDGVHDEDWGQLLQRRGGGGGPRTRRI